LPPAAPRVWDAVRPLVGRVPSFRRAQNFLDYTCGGIRAYARARPGVRYFEERRMFGDLLHGGRVARRGLPASATSAKRLVADVLAFHRRMHFTSEFMTKVDGATMYHSLEARAPFLDQGLWEFAAQLPPAIHFHGGRLKAVLREIVRRRVGPEVAFRPKQGFTIPVERWLTSQWRRHLQELKDGSLLAAQGWIQPQALSAAVDEALSSKEAPEQLWYALVLEHWLRRQAALTAERSVRQVPLGAFPSQ